MKEAPERVQMLPGAGARVGSLVRSGVRADARDLLRDHVLTVVGADAENSAPYVDPAVGGLVVTGARANTAVSALRNQYPHLVLLAEPNAPSTYTATKARPFKLDDAGLLQETLDAVLDGQLRSGADVAITPTGFIDAGDWGAAKAAVEQANLAAGDNILTLLPVSPRWCAEPAVDQLIAIAKRSRHPVAIALVSNQGNPWSAGGVVEGYRRLFDEVQWAMPWRTDLAAFASLASGAPAAALGQRPGNRRVNPPGKHGIASVPANRYPHVLLRDLLRFSRSDFMQTAWFASTEPYVCTCTHCGGRAVSRFGASTDDVLSAHLHNLEIVTSLMRECMALDPSDRAGWWAGLVRRAAYAHDELAAYTSVKVVMPADLQAWAKVFS